ncbi:17194_t:CDS:2, partial [Funneliformis geosporum]
NQKVRTSRHNLPSFVNIAVASLYSRSCKGNWYKNLWANAVIATVLVEIFESRENELLQVIALTHSATFPSQSTLAAMLLRLLRQEKGALLQEEEILDEKSIAVDLGTGEDIYKGSTPIYAEYSVSTISYLENKVLSKLVSILRDGTVRFNTPRTTSRHGETIPHQPPTSTPWVY